MLKKYDTNNNGRLDGTEREHVRKERKKILDRTNSNRKRAPRQEEKHPPELLKKYDKDNSGWIDGKEWEVAMPQESAIMKKQYDEDKDGKLSEEEKAKIMEDMRSQKLKGVYAGIAWYSFFRGQQGREPAYMIRQKSLLKFDSNKDGIASRAELASIRKHRSNQNQEKK